MYAVHIGIMLMFTHASVMEYSTHGTDRWMNGYQTDAFCCGGAQPSKNASGCNDVYHQSTDSVTTPTHFSSWSYSKTDDTQC